MNTVEEKLETAVKGAVADTKDQLFKEFCQATTERDQNEIRSQFNLLGKLTHKLKKNINRGK